MSWQRIAVMVLFPATVGMAQDDAGELFEKRIRPLLAGRCYTCHSRQPSAGLRVDSRAAMLKGGISGPAIVPGDASKSLLIRAVSQGAPHRMPLNAAKLADDEIAALSRWVEAGAPWPERPTSEQTFWSFLPLRKPDLPAVGEATWPRTAVDRFVLAALERKGRKPAPAADRRTLIRRASFDLIGLPPTPEEVRAFVGDTSPDAFAKVVDRLLASPHYGERWGRHWLDVARYADGDAPDNRPVYIGYGMAKDGFANTFRYRDWVVHALNSDMPYDRFVRAQIAADLMPEAERPSLLPGLGFFGLGPWFTGDDVVFAEARANERDDKIDALTKGFLGLTVACARCHDHKFDPIPQKDYYALGGIFASSGYAEYPLVPDSQAKRYRAQQDRVRAQEKAIEAFVSQTQIEVATRMAAQTARYLMAVRSILMTKPRPDPAKVAAAAGLDSETLNRWGRYLSAPQKIEHPYLRPWFELMAAGGGSDGDARNLATGYQKLVLDVIAEKLAVRAANERAAKSYLPDPDERRVALPGDLMQFERFQYKQKLVEKVMQPHRFYVWLDVVQGEQASQDYEKKDGIFEYDFNRAKNFYTEEEKSRLNGMIAALKRLEKDLPPEYPYTMGLADTAPLDLNLNLRGNPHALVEVVPRGLPQILGGARISNGSGRLELADAILQHPLAARVIVNRVWMHHFGQGIVATPSNFGAGGDRPTDPALLDYLASSLIGNGWSLKELHREIMLSAAYQQQSASARRLDVEALRDSLLFVSGLLDETMGGPPIELGAAENHRRTLYARIRRSVYVCNSGTGGLDRMLQLFDFPDPTTSVDHRSETTVPLQSLFFLNSDLVMKSAGALAARLQGDDRAKIAQAYEILFNRPPSAAETELGLDFLRGSPWPQYAQALLASGEFAYVQ